MSIITSIGFLSLLAAPAAAFWRLPCKSTLVVERADPIVAPGNVSGHVHQIMGGNGFDFDMDYADTQASTCTSCTVHGDFSNYWTPVLYYQHQDGSFEKVDQMGGGLIYYLQRGGPNNDKLQAFPEGFRMIAGDPFKRTAGDDAASQGVSYNCLDYNKQGGNPETPGFPNMNCPNGLRSQLFFPSCWDGKNLDMPDHKSHMAYPIGAYNNGKCPDTHPIHLVSIFFEILWDVNKFKDMWYGNSQPFVWAMGDPTGYGFHGDFLMGWDRNLLQSAIDTCTSDSGRVEDCPVFNLYPDSTAQGCKLPSKIDEDIQGPFAKLPGCNPVQKGPDRAQIIQTCDGNTATIGQGKSFFKDLTSSGWGYQGCGVDNYYSRALTGASTSQPDMTNEKCVKFCGDKGFSIAGTEWSKECYCGNSLPDSAKPIAGVVGNCDMSCSGDANDFCGGSSRLSIYQKCADGTCSNAAGLGGTKPAVTSATAAGAASTSSSSSLTSKISSRGLESPSSTPSSSLTSKISSRGLESPSSTTTTPKTTATTTPKTTATSTSASQTTTTTKSSTKSSASPTNTSTTSSSPSPSTLPPNWTYLTCLTDTLSPRTLPKLAPYTINNTPVTSTSCATWCSSAGYSFAGTEYGGECWCGNSIPSGAKKVDESKCSMPCKGDGGQKCGGSATLSVYGVGNGNGSVGVSKRGVGVDGEGEIDGVRKHMKKHSRIFQKKSVFD